MTRRALLLCFGILLAGYPCIRTSADESDAIALRGRSAPAVPSGARDLRPLASRSKLDPDRPEAPRRVPGELELGSVFVNGIIPCAEGLPVGAVCRSLTVECPGLDDATVVVAVTEPIAPVATIVFHNGSGGTTFFGNGFPEVLLPLGFRIVQVGWDFDWPVDVGFKTSSCRPATVFHWIHENVHREGRSNGFCGLGHSGGGSAMAYALSFYGLGDDFDFVILNSGPPVGRIDYGCEPDLYPGGPVYLCSQIPDAPFAYELNRAVEINPVEATTTCGEPYDDHTLADAARWEADSLVSGGGVYDFPLTPLSFYYCSIESNSAVGLGSFYADAVTSSRIVHCIAGECIGEGTFRDPAAFQQIVDEFRTSCIPRH